MAPHFANRNRLKRLQRVLDRNPDHFGLGIDEQTAVEVRGGRATVLGNASVRVCFPSSLDRMSARVLKAGHRLDLDDLRRAVAAGPK